MLLLAHSVRRRQASGAEARAVVRFGSKHVGSLAFDPSLTVMVISRTLSELSRMCHSLRRNILVVALLAFGPALAADDQLGVSGPIDLAGTRYELASADEPQPGYVKQDYLPAGQTLDRHETMVLIEFLEGEETPADIVRSQVQMLEKRRAIDPLVNYEISLANEGDAIILDFIMSGETEAGIRSAEWNAYRYVGGKNKDGAAGGWLVGISRRAYGEDITSFLSRLRDSRPGDVAAIVALDVPPKSAD